MPGTPVLGPQIGNDDCEHVIAYGSRLLTKPEQQYCVTQCELLAVITFTNHFRPYLLVRKFTLRTDHGSLQWLKKFKEPEGQVARWLEALQEIDFEIVHHRGKLTVMLTRCQGHPANSMVVLHMIVQTNL